MLRITFNKPAVSGFFQKGRAVKVRVREGKVEFRPSEKPPSDIKIEPQKRGGFIAFVGGDMESEIAKVLRPGAYTLGDPHYGWFGTKPVNGDPVLTLPLIRVRAAEAAAKDEPEAAPIRRRARRTPPAPRRVGARSRVAPRPAERQAERPAQPSSNERMAELMAQTGAMFTKMAETLGLKSPAAPRGAPPRGRHDATAESGQPQSSRRKGRRKAAQAEADKPVARAVAAKAKAPPARRGRKPKAVQPPAAAASKPPRRRRGRPTKEEVAARTAVATTEAPKPVEAPSAPPPTAESRPQEAAPEQSKEHAPAPEMERA